ncbi:tyrosine-type recombinase/integrase [Marinobacter salarius]|uniref:site-specific integrase n=1 Tax=Marinobacter salarius TaxID=1420917 RepID=UPI00273CCEB8|nr:site-specific integrase [Marinobacter salarius]MDP4532513.1 tyrosine-type recombinase/integrase [Marinobacter salarius]
MTHIPSYLLRSRHSVWYFRIAVPQSIRTLVGCREIRRSLGTRSKRHALIQSRELLRQVQSLFTEAFQGTRPDTSAIGFEQESSKEASGRLYGEPTGALSERVRGEPEAPKGYVGPTITQVMDEYGQYQRMEGVSLKTVADKASVVALLVRIVGDVPVSHLNRKDAQSFRETALKLPPRATQQSEKSLAKLAEQADKTISVTTFNHYVKHLKTLFVYAIQEGYCDKNPFEGLKIRQRTKTNSLRSRFDSDDLRRLFSPATYERKDSPKAYRYWLPFLGLYTGARLNELCQLYVDDVVSIDGIDCLHIQATKPGQKLKNAASERLIPIHPKLKELGFLAYVDGLKDRGCQRVFPELSLHKRHGFAANPSRWFANYRAKVGFRDGEERKDFHSFRHTVADELKQAGISESLIAALLGHTSGGITYNRYGKDYAPGLLLPVVNLLSFDGIGSSGLRLATTSCSSSTPC